MVLIKLLSIINDENENDENDENLFRPFIKEKYKIKPIQSIFQLLHSQKE